MSLTHMNSRNPLNATEAFEQVLELITNKLNEHQEYLQNIWDEERDVIDGSDLEMLNYHEGAVEVLSIVQHQAQELFKNVN